MIMPAGQETLLLPVKGRFLYGSLLVALLLQMVLRLSFGRQAGWLPDLFAITLIFWTLNQPRYIGIATAFFCGLITDTYSYSALGLHALSYVVMAGFIGLVQRRLTQFSAWEQTAQIVLVFITGLVFLVFAGAISSSLLPHWSSVLKPLLETALWPVASFILLAPQRRPPDPDLHRPL